MTAGGGSRLDRPRDLPALFRDAFALLLARPLAFLAVAAAFTVPVELVVSGIGLERLTAGYEREPEPIEAVIEVLAGYVLVAPLVTVACALLVAGRAGSAGRAILRALELSTPLLLAVIVVAAGVAVGLFLLIVPGVYLLVRWFLVPQVVALEEARGLEPLRRSGRLVEGRWLRTAATVLLANLAVALPALLIAAPFERWAQSVDREAPALAGAILSELVTTPIVAVVGTLLFFDLREREREAF